MKSPALAEKYKQGPVGFLNILPNGPPSMPKFLVLWFVYCLVIGFFVAYLTGRTLAAGTNYLAVFRVAGTAAFLAYGLGNLSNGIWKGQTWGATIEGSHRRPHLRLADRGDVWLALAAVGPQSGCGCRGADGR